jgi:hypothetical protein
MAISIPIISEFDGKGIEKARKEFSQLEGAGAKAQYAIKKAALPAAAALGAVGVALFDATKGAMEDAAAQDVLARNLRATTGATDAQIAANENWIASQGQLLGVSDDQLRPAITKLARATGSLSKAQALASQAMDIAAATGKPLETVTSALEKAYGGNMTALQKLAPEYRQMIKDGASFEEVMAKLQATTGGAAQTFADTAEGGMKRLSLGISETKESIGAALLPVLEAVLPYVNGLATWAQQNPGVFLAVAGAIGAIATAILAINFAMAANPITLIAIGIGALIAALGVAYTKFEAVRTVVDGVFGAIKWWINNVTIPAFKLLLDVVKTIFNGIAMVWNNTFGKIKFSVPSWVPGIGGKGFDVPDIPMLANGGIVDSPTLALIGESGPEAVVTLDRMGGMGGNNVTINVNGGDPEAVVNALRRYMQVNGSVPIRVSA